MYAYFLHVTSVNFKQANLGYRIFFHDKSLLPTRISKVNTALTYWTWSLIKIVFDMDLGPLYGLMPF